MLTKSAGRKTVASELAFMRFSSCILATECNNWSNILSAIRLTSGRQR